MNKLDYKKTPINKLIMRLALPGIVASIVASINFIIDGIFAGKILGSDSLAAINLVMPILLIIFALVDMVATGSSVRIGISLGEKIQNMLQKYFLQVFL